MPFNVEGTMTDTTRRTDPTTTGIDPPLARAQQHISAELARIDRALPGIVERMMRCGKRRCRCKTTRRSYPAPTSNGPAP